MNNEILKKNEEIVKLIISDLVPVIVDDLQLDLQNADDIVRGTEFFRVLSAECALSNDYDLNNLKLLLRKELIRDRKYPTVEGNPITDYHDFVKTMRHEIVYNISMCNNLKLNLTQVSFLVENIENLTINEDDVKLLQDIYKLFDRCVCYLNPADTGNLDEIWWRLNSFIQILLQHCKMFNVDVDDLSVDLIHDYLDFDSPWRPTYKVEDIKINGFEPTPEFFEFAEKEKRGELTDQDIKNFLKEKHKMKK